MRLSRTCGRRWHQDHCWKQKPVAWWIFHLFFRANQPEKGILQIAMEVDCPLCWHVADSRPAIAPVRKYRCDVLRLCEDTHIFLSSQPVFRQPSGCRGLGGQLGCLGVTKLCRLWELRECLARQEAAALQIEPVGQGALSDQERWAAARRVGSGTRVRS